ncbi:putative membrane protein [Synechococcus sp. ROS8604]|nr:putative membrane protein [Synechococcus sp. ROS8604]
MHLILFNLYWFWSACFAVDSLIHCSEWFYFLAYIASLDCVRFRASIAFSLACLMGIVSWRLFSIDLAEEGSSLEFSV